MTGSEFKKLRQQIRISQEACGPIFGGYQDKISRWETGASAIPESAANLMAILAGNLKASELLAQAQTA